MERSQRIGFAKAKTNRLTERKLRMTAVVCGAKAKQTNKSLICQAEIQINTKETPSQGRGR